MRPAGSHEYGKISKALWITETFQEEVEADLQRYYRLDFLDLYRPGSGLGWRKLLVLVEHLPPESALNTAIRNDLPEDNLARRAGDPVKAPWSTLESLMAALIDEVRNVGWMYASRNSESTIPRPVPIPRPGLSARKQRGRIVDLARAQKLDPRLRGLSPEEAQDMMDRLTGHG